MSLLLLLGAAEATPPATWNAQIIGRLEDGARAFRVTDEGHVAHAAGFRVALTDETLWASTAEDDIGIRLVGWGREGAERDLAGSLPEVGACVAGAFDVEGACVRRVELRRDGMTEYWQSTRAGVEQGWEIDERLDGAGPLELDLALDAASWFVDADGATIHGLGGSTWRYDGLAAWDADGEPLDAWMVATDVGIQLVVDDRDATYPLLVDPTLVEGENVWADDPYEGDKFGYSVSGAGDVNADGFTDVIVGAVSDGGNATNSGVAYVFHGSADGLTEVSAAQLYAAEGVLDGRFGHCVSDAGDVNADGFDDVVISAVSGDDDGTLHVFYGSEDGVLLESEQLVELSGGRRLGDQVAAAGDVNGDGYADVVAGHPGANEAYVWFGSADGLDDRTKLEGPEAEPDENTRFGTSVDGAGDIDGDGYDDIVVSAWGFAQVHVFMGSSRGPDDEPDQVLEGDRDEKFGTVVSGLGDVNGDGYADIATGAPDADTYGKNAGALHVFLGSEDGVDVDSELVLGPSDGEDGWEYAVAFDGAGDLDGDGIDDVVVGAPGADYQGSSAGAVYVYSGSRNGVDPTSEGRYALDDNHGFRLGNSVAGADDVNGDGQDDVIAGSYKSAYADYSEAGTAVVFYGCEDEDCGGLAGTDDGDGGTRPWDPDAPPACGCSAGAAPGAGFAGLALLALVWRRRSR